MDKSFDSVEKRLDNIEQHLEMMTEKESNANEDVIVLLKKFDKQTNGLNTFLVRLENRYDIKQIQKLTDLQGPFSLRTYI